VIDGDPREVEQLLRETHMAIASEKSQWEQRRVGRSLSLGREDSARGVGGFARSPAAFQHHAANAPPRQFARRGEADDSSPDDDDVARVRDRYSI